MEDICWSRERTYQLIQLYKDSPALWDRRSKKYCDRELRRKCMETIARSMRVTEEETTRKLHNLRCQLNSELRKLRTRKSWDAEDETRSSVWEFFEALQFIIGVTKPVQRITASCSSSSTIPLKSEDSPVEFIGVEIEDDSPVEEKFAVTTPTIPVVLEALRKRKRTSRNSKLHTTVNNKAVLPKIVAVQGNEKDEFDIFGEFVAVELRLIASEEKRKRMKRLIQRVLLEMSEEDDDEN